MYALYFLQEEARALIASPSEVGVEQTISNLVLWLRLIVEATGAVIIGIGLVVAAYVFIRSRTAGRPQGYNRIRLTLSRFLALALEFQLGADILSTAIAPSWDQIGKLAAVAAIRTALNYFLTHEMKEEQEDITGDASHADARTWRETARAVGNTDTLRDDGSRA